MINNVEYQLKNALYLTTEQEIWLRAYCAAVAGGKQYPHDEARSCVAMFKAEFGDK